MVTAVFRLVDLLKFTGSGVNMTVAKARKRVEELKGRETQLFDTYRRNKRDEDKVKHLREMADVIEEKAQLIKKYRI